jgi:hypothetical protein
MADSKISDLPLSPYILDKDLMVVVTGHLEEGSFPENIKVPLGLIRRYIVRLNLLTSPQSGISTYYNSGANILTINHSPLTGNLMRYDYATDFPYNQTISTTGLNCVAGNNIELNFASNTASSLVYGKTGPPFHSGIISTTGLNMLDGNGIAYTIESAWPHKYTILNSEKTKTKTTAEIISNLDNNFAPSTSGYNLLSINYSDFYQSKTNESLKLLCTIGLKVSNITFDPIPFVPASGLTNERKQLELSNQNSQDFAETSSSFVVDTFELKVGISGGGNNFINTIHTYPITIKNTNGPNDTDCSEIYRNGIPGFALNGIDPIIIREPITLTLNSNSPNNSNTICIYASISNVQYTRTYVGPDFINGIKYVSANAYSSTSATIYPLFIKTENIIS